MINVDHRDCSGVHRHTGNLLMRRTDRPALREFAALYLPSLLPLSQPTPSFIKMAFERTIKGEIAGFDYITWVNVLDHLF